MKTHWKRMALFGGLIALVSVLVVGSVAFAQDTDDKTGWPFNFGQKLHEAIAKVLGISVDEYDAAIETAQGQLLEEAVTEGWLTQEQADQLQERMEGGFGFEGMPFGHGGRGGRMGGWMGGPENSLLDVAAEQLNLEVKDLLAELRDGKSIADVAEEQGVDPQTIADAYIAKVSENLAEAVAEERITQEQADQMLERLEEQVTAQLDSTGDFPMDRFKGQTPEGFQRDFGGRGGRAMPFDGFDPRGFGGRGPIVPDDSGESTTSTATQL